MGPSTYVPYCTAVASSRGGALVGLLFVALSLRNDPVVGKDANPA